MEEIISKQREDRNDLTTGPILKKLILFFLPIAAGTLIQQLYNTVDAFVVGKYVGTDALAAVGGSPATYSNLIIGFCTALAGGCGVVIAQYFGEKNDRAVSNAVKTSYLFCSLLGILISVVVILFSPELLRLLKTPEDTFQDALIYQRIYFAGGFFLLIFNMGCGILRSVGKAGFPFVCLFVSCGLNIVLDLLFVIGLQWGVPGVAWATVISEGVSAVMVTVNLLTAKDSYRLSLSAKCSRQIFSRMMRIGIPSGLESSTYGISNLILQVAINDLGKLVVASWAMSGKVDGVYWAISMAFGTAITTFVGQNFGAGKEDRIRRTTKVGMIFLLSVTVALSGSLLLLGRPILRILTDDAGVVDTTWKIMCLFVPFYFLWSIIEVLSGVLRGVSDAFVPSVILALGICGFRILWIYTAFPINPTLEMLSICYPASWILSGLAIFIHYLRRRKHFYERR